MDAEKLRTDSPRKINNLCPDRPAGVHSSHRRDNDMPVRRALLLLPLLAAVSALAVDAQAQDRRERADPPVAAAARPAAPQLQARPLPRLRSQDGMAESIRHIRSSTRGTLISAERMHSNGREINRIKVVDDRGRVRVYEDDPQQRRRSRRDDD
ncbi:hypothetical protein QFW77_08670 [Luteimonas sp. RD2P54]|uniref:PepSY domain-containing protein n=1 Tax=Luteimonas endophytica TaxID=3042023 RepID=A0ABT6J8B3_9GAMM|nr:hypothetical protein [Luteimonas endophytica]MDH5823060.1 hypothetical protein [Luteimonas endophytica]